MVNGIWFLQGSTSGTIDYYNHTQKLGDFMSSPYGWFWVKMQVPLAKYAPAVLDVEMVKPLLLHHWSVVKLFNVQGGMILSVKCGVEMSAGANLGLSSDARPFQEPTLGWVERFVCL
ncbi:hypothetical protein AVEN_104523-1 [Araneus ventricosus]|uniref:Uncharacterized protein n=1 Tax=Araneus ventricosus TaxID=182803 RepID=A0A4Y2SJD4_ARAVE|nr:hypothetical protein AVEN_104523-1 [Araneus ventricosus]